MEEIKSKETELLEQLHAKIEMLEKKKEQEVFIEKIKAYAFPAVICIIGFFLIRTYEQIDLIPKIQSDLAELKGQVEVLMKDKISFLPAEEHHPYNRQIELYQAPVAILPESSKSKEIAEK